MNLCVITEHVNETAHFAENKELTCVHLAGYMELTCVHLAGYMEITCVHLLNTQDDLRKGVTSVCTYVFAKDAK